MRVTGAVITGKGQMRVQHETRKLCYLVLIPYVYGECYIVKRNFRVNVSPEVPFESEHAPVVRVPRTDVEGVDRAALQNIVPNVRGQDSTKPSRSIAMQSCSSRT